MQYWQHPNNVVLGGRITNDLVLKEVKADTKILDFSIANNLKVSGENKENKGHFFRLEAWGKTAEAISKYFSKGDTIIVKGELYWSSWQDKESGAKREGVRIRVSEFYFGGDSPKRSEEQGDVTAPPVRPAAKEVFYKTPLPQTGLRPKLPSALPGDDDIPM